MRDLDATVTDWQVQQLAGRGPLGRRSLAGRRPFCGTHTTTFQVADGQMKTPGRWAPNVDDGRKVAHKAGAFVTLQFESKEVSGTCHSRLSLGQQWPLDCRDVDNGHPF